MEDYIIIRIPRSHMGRPSKKPSDAELEYQYERHTQRELMEIYNVSKATIFRWLRSAGLAKYNTKGVSHHASKAVDYKRCPSDAPTDTVRCS